MHSPSFDRDLRQINGTIESYAKTVQSPHKYSLSNSSTNGFDSNDTFVTTDVNMKPKGSRAVLSALRALQNKISTMSKEHASMQSNYESEINRIRSENIELKEKYTHAKSKIKELLTVNREIAKRVKNSENDQLNEKRNSQTLLQKLTNLQTQFDIKKREMNNEIEILKGKLNTQSNFELQLRDQSQEIDKLETKVVVLTDQLNHYKHLATSIDNRKKTADSLVETLMAENDQLHLQIGSLQEKLTTMQGRRSRRVAHKIARERQEAMSSLLSSPKLTTIKQNPKKLKRRKSRNNDFFPNSFNHSKQIQPPTIKLSTRNAVGSKRNRALSARQHRPTPKHHQSEDYVYFKKSNSKTGDMHIAASTKADTYNHKKSKPNLETYEQSEQWVHAGPAAESFSKVAKKQIKRKKKIDKKLLLQDPSESENILLSTKSDNSYYYSPSMTKKRLKLDSSKNSMKNKNSFLKDSQKTIHFKKEQNDDSWEIESSFGSTKDSAGYEMRNDDNNNGGSSIVHVDIDNIIQNYDKQLKDLGIMSD